MFAATEFSVKPEQWCFFVAGCVGYRGYFEQARAEAFATEEAAQAIEAKVASYLQRRAGEAGW